MPRNYYSYRRKSTLSLLAVILSLLVLYAQHMNWLGPAAKTIESAQPGQYSVAHFVDGDTIAVNMNGKVEKVRFVGVDTPETHKPNTPVQCYGPAAAAYTKTIIGSSTVRLVSDSLSTDRDRYGRLLRYVYLPDGTNLNEKLIQTGHGFYYPYFPFTKSEAFAADQAAAQNAHLGLWGNCSPTPTDKGGYVSNPQ